MSALTATQAETLALFTSGADDLEQAIQGLSETELDYAGTPDGWTIRQIVHHIADDGDAWSMNFKKALATPGAVARRIEAAGAGYGAFHGLEPKVQIASP